MQLPDTIRTYTELNRYAIKAGCSAVLRVYYSVRQHNQDATGGNGWLSKADYMAFVTQSLRLSQRQAHNLYQQGLGVFWNDDPERPGYVLLVGLVKLGQLLINTGAMDTRLGFRVDLEGRRFKSLKVFRAYAFAAYFARSSWSKVDNKLRAAGGQIISKQTQADLFGVSVSTIKGWHRILGYTKRDNKWIKKSKPDLVKTPVYGYSKAMTDPKQASRLPDTDIPNYIQNGGVKPQYFDIDQDGQLEATWQLPNQLKTPNLEAFRAWQNRQLEGLTKSTKADKQKRIYYDQTPKVRACRDRSSQRSIYVQTRKPKGVQLAGLLYQAVVI